MIELFDGYDLNTRPTPCAELTRRVTCKQHEIPTSTVLVFDCTVTEIISGQITLNCSLSSIPVALGGPSGVFYTRPHSR